MIFFSLEFDLLVMLIVILSTISQAVLGVGVLLWGTPLLLLVGVEYIDALNIVLPISIAISFAQSAGYMQSLNKKMFSKFFVCAIPGIIVGLYYLLSSDLVLSNIVAIILLLTIAIRRISAVGSFAKISSSGRADALLIFVIGLIHGISNLGGSLLVARLSLEKLDKVSFRTTVAAVYVMFALSQLLILLTTHTSLAIPVYYLIFSLLTYAIVNRTIFNGLNARVYESLLDPLIFLISMMLIFF